MKKITMFLFLMVIALLVFIIYEKVVFPVKYIICDSLYEKCFVDAKFKDIRNCEMVKEKGEWYCDQTDKRNIKCEERDSNISVSYCSK